MNTTRPKAHGWLDADRLEALARRAEAIATSLQTAHHTARTRADAEPDYTTYGRGAQDAYSHAGALVANLSNELRRYADESTGATR